MAGQHQSVMAKLGVAHKEGTVIMEDKKIRTHVRTKVTKNSLEPVTEGSAVCVRIVCCCLSECQS